MEETVGSRGLAALKPLSSYMNEFFKCIFDAFDPVTNPKGYIAICTAENKLVQAKLTERLMQPNVLKAAFSDDMVYCYNSFLGLPPAREAVANFLTRKFLCPESTDSNKVNPNHVALGSGCASLINSLCYVLAEEGDAVLIPAPYYAVFDSDVEVSQMR